MLRVVFRGGVAGFEFEASFQNEGNTRQQGKGMILNLAIEAWVSISVNQSSSVWVTLSPRVCLQLSTDICGHGDEGRDCSLA